MVGVKAATTIVLVLLLIFDCAMAARAQDRTYNQPELEPLADFVGGGNMSVMNLVGYKATKEAMDRLGFRRGDPGILALTDAGYIANIGGYSSAGALDGVMQTAGVSTGKRNLVNVHRGYSQPLWFAFFDKASGNCVYIEVNRSYLLPWLAEEAKGTVNLSEFMETDASALFSRISEENIDPDRLITEEGAKAWHHNFVDKTFGGNEFSIVTISAIWSKGISNELLRCAELHNHICPGLVSGYYIAQYLKEKYPTERGNKWVVWAVPPWCKDDAI